MLGLRCLLQIVAERIFIRQAVSSFFFNFELSQPKLSARVRRCPVCMTLRLVPLHSACAVAAPTRSCAPAERTCTLSLRGPQAEGLPERLPFKVPIIEMPMPAR